MRQYMKVLQSELVGGEMAYLAYQAGIINETTFENNLIHTEPNKSSAEAVFEAIEIEMTQRPSLFHKFVNLLQNMGNEVLKQVAVEMQEQHAYELWRKLPMMWIQQPILTFTVDYNGKHIDMWREHGIALEIPKGAITHGMSVTFVVSFTTSPHFPLPEGYELISPVYLILPSFKFNKNVTVKIQHWAILEDEDDASRVIFMHRSKEGIVLHNGVFNNGSSWGALNTSTFTEFASLREQHPIREKKYYQVDICTPVGTKAAWTSHFCIIAREYKMKTCIWLRSAIEQQMKPELGQGTKLFKFAPNCRELQFDDKELRLSAAQQGYDTHFTTIKTVQKIELETTEEPVCRSMDVTLKENEEVNHTYLDCMLPMKCTFEDDSRDQCNLTLTNPVSLHNRPHQHIIAEGSCNGKGAMTSHEIEIKDRKSLEQELAEIGNWEVLCDNLGVDASVLAPLKVNGMPVENKKKDCLKAFVKGEQACWEKVVQVVAADPFHNKKLAKNIAKNHYTDYNNVVSKDQ